MSNERPYLIMKAGEPLDWEGKIDGPEVEYCKCTGKRCKGPFANCSTCSYSYEAQREYEEYWDRH